MKTKIVFSLVSVALMVFAENSFGMEDVAETINVVKALPETEASLENDRIAGTQGTEGATNTFYGLGAGSSTTGIENSFFGRSAGYNNTQGHNNSFFGYGSGYQNTTIGVLSGSSNAFFGYYSGHDNTIGTSNSFFGSDAGRTNTTGISNSFFGRSAGNKNTDGAYNSFFGRNAGHDNTTGYSNAFFGLAAGRYNTTGSWNSFFGMYAGESNVSGSGNVFLGTNAGNCSPTDKSNQLFIDNSNTPTPLIWGDFENDNVIIYGNFRAIATSTSSDGRWKKNIRPLKSSLEKVSNLQGVSYEWKTDEYSGCGLKEGKQIGLVAQDVEEVLPELVSQDKDGYKAVSYAKLTAVLVEAVKELKAKNEKQVIENEALRAENVNLKKDIEKIKAILGI